VSPVSWIKSSTFDPRVSYLRYFAFCIVCQEGGLVGSNFAQVSYETIKGELSIKNRDLVTKNEEVMMKNGDLTMQNEDFNY
jgi:hypothetical protein